MLLNKFQNKLTSKQMLQSLPIALAPLKVGNISENLLNEIYQIIYFLFWAKEITEKVYNNRMNSIKLHNRMDPIFMNSENSRTYEAHRLYLILQKKST